MSSVATSTIAVVGSLTRDIIFETERIPKLGESVAGTGLSFRHAGKGANIAVAAHRASHTKSKQTDFNNGITNNNIRVFMNGAVGDDDVGPPLRNSLGAQGIDITGVQILPGEQTGQALITLDTIAGQASQLGFKGANLLFQPRNDTVESLAGNENVRPSVVIAHCTMDLATVQRILEMASSSGVETILSASPPVKLDRTIYASTTHIILNEHEATEMMGRDVADLADLDIATETAASFVNLGVKFVVVTLGEAGAVYATDDGAKGHVPAKKEVNVRDTTGAGDSFLGAYAVDLVRQRTKGEFDIETAVMFGNSAAARTIQSLGAQASLPWADEIIE